MLLRRRRQGAGVNRLCLGTETCCVAIVGDEVLIEPQTVVSQARGLIYTAPEKRNVFERGPAGSESLTPLQ